jgi:hypothetical protein
MLGAGVPGGYKVTGEWSSGRLLRSRRSASSPSRAIRAPKSPVTLASLTIVKVTTDAGATQCVTL